MDIFELNRKVLILFAKKYIWWQKPEEALDSPWRILAAVMNTGSLEDSRAVLNIFGKDVLLKTIETASPGWFSPRSWSMWHRVLRLVDYADTVPPLPERSFN